MQDPRVALRPEIITDQAAHSSDEQFQNQVLRPIIKMQHPMILDVYRHFLQKRKVPFGGMSIEQRSRWIETSLSKDNRLRGILLGLVVGHFTQDELAFFLEREGESRRRIINLIAQRLQSQMKALL